MFDILEFNEFGTITKVVFNGDLEQSRLVTALEFISTWNTGNRKEAIALLAPKVSHGQLHSQIRSESL